jgi:hypothetical protein
MLFFTIDHSVFIFIIYGYRGAIIFESAKIALGKNLSPPPAGKNHDIVKEGG